MLSLTTQLHQPATSPTTIDHPSMFAYYSPRTARTGPTRSSPRHRLKPSMPKGQHIDFKGKIGFVRSVLHSLSAAPRCTILHNSAQFHALGTRGSLPAAGHPPTGPATRRNHAPHHAACPHAPQTMRHSGSGRDSAEESCAQLDFRINLILSCG